jgi:4-amino-4-deoxy-L-arabinose transferase-like glycosyltransferase
MEKLLLTRNWRIDPWQIAISICFGLFAWLSWGKLAHPIFEPGPETEVTARLLAGQVLYRDLQSYYSPLAYYFNAFALLIFGHHLEVFYAVGLGLTLTIVLLVYQLAKQLTNPPWAALCAAYILIYCAFKPGGLFNLVVPYSYGAVYATVFCLLAFTALDYYGQTGRRRWILMAALAAGLAGLSKQEFGVAALVAVIVGINVFPARSFTTRVGRTLLAILIAVSCVGLVLALVAQQSSWQQLSASLVPIGKSKVLVETGLLFWSPLQTLVWWRGSLKNFSKDVVIIGIDLMLTHRIASYINQNYLKIRSRFSKDFIVFSLGISLAYLSLWIVQSWHWINPRPFGNAIWLLPLLSGWFMISWRSLIQDRHAVLLWSLLSFCIVLYARFWFNLDYYGIYAVAAILLLFPLLKSLSSWTKIPIWSYVLVCLLIGGTTNLMRLQEHRYPISSIYGQLYTTESKLASTYNHILDYIHRSGVKSVLTVPTGAILNFLSATHSPSQETFFLPGILPDSESERNFIMQMQQQPPDLIVYVDLVWSWHKKGYQTFAQYNPLVDDWITHQHQLVYTSPQLVSGLFDKSNREWNIRIYK